MDSLADKSQIPGIKIMVVLLEEMDNVFEEVNDEVDYARAIVPPRFVANNATGACFVDKTFNRIAIILDRIVKRNHAWNRGDKSGGINLCNLSLSHLMKEY
ncbi:hypothetical protein HAX54_037138 [Datura stramonium]|uniref:Uncharacterized protein n=1 Tax=Datura stramonium TaxID=4076 RepID=A0ABS8SGZ4_DATST|nr:hypothetical protein [Datura stramonium]